LEFLKCETGVDAWFASRSTNSHDTLKLQGIFFAGSVSKKLGQEPKGLMILLDLGTG
jgi:hypothetical protein